MFGRKSLGFLLVLILLGCAKIDGFDKPYSMEAFTGSFEVDSAIQNLSAGARTTYVISISTDATGKKAYVYGIPPESPFPLIPQKTWDKLETLGLLKNVGPTDLVPTVAGLVGTVEDRSTIKVTQFQRTSKLADKLGLEVTGEIVRIGKQLAITEDVIISANVGKLKAMLPKVLLDEMHHEGESKSLSQLSDEKRVNLYRITFQGDVFTPF